LAAAGFRPGLLGTVEVRVGGERRPALRTTPEAVDLQRTLREMLDAGDRSCAIEATSHGSELGRLAGTRFAALAFTNLTQDHLDLHETMERYFDAKRRLFVTDEAIAQGIASVRGVPGRFEPVDEGQPFLVVVDYSHKPDALESALAAARGLADGRVICVFGCGGDRDRGKRPLMGKAAEEGSDLAILTSDNPRSE